jgi:hypothetical protein
LKGHTLQVLLITHGERKAGDTVTEKVKEVEPSKGEFFGLPSGSQKAP